MGHAQMLKFNNELTFFINALNHRWVLIGVWIEFGQNKIELLNINVRSDCTLVMMSFTNTGYVREQTSHNASNKS